VRVKALLGSARSLLIAVLLVLISLQLGKMAGPAWLTATAWALAFWSGIDFLRQHSRRLNAGIDSWGYTTYDVVVLAALAIAGGLLRTYWGAARMMIESVAGPLAIFITGAGIYLWAILACRLVRKPFSGSIAMVFGGVMELLAGNPAGLSLLLINLVEGLGADVPYALWRYRKYTHGVDIAAGMLSAYLGILFSWIGFGFAYLGLWPLAVYLLTTGVSGVVAGVAGHYLADALQRMGVRPRGTEI
jgi:energy-coupling factor transport system permease protein